MHYNFSTIISGSQQLSEHGCSIQSHSQIKQTIYLVILSKGYVTLQILGLQEYTCAYVYINSYIFLYMYAAQMTSIYCYEMYQ